MPQGKREKRFLGPAISKVFRETKIFQAERHIEKREMNLSFGLFMSLPWYVVTTGILRWLLANKPLNP